MLKPVAAGLAFVLVASCASMTSPALPATPSLTTPTARPSIPTAPLPTPRDQSGTLTLIATIKSDTNPSRDVTADVEIVHEDDAGDMKFEKVNKFVYSSMNGKLFTVIIKAPAYEVWVLNFRNNGKEHRTLEYEIKLKPKQGQGGKLASIAWVNGISADDDLDGAETTSAVCNLPAPPPTPDGCTDLAPIAPPKKQIPPACIGSSSYTYDNDTHYETILLNVTVKHPELNNATTTTQFRISKSSPAATWQWSDSNWNASCGKDEGALAWATLAYLNGNSSAFNIYTTPPKTSYITRLNKLRLHPIALPLIER